MSELIVVFGATGSTGTHLVRLALDAGLRVRAFVRSPDKIPEAIRGHDQLEIFQGDLTDSSAIDQALEGADYAVSTAGNALASKKGYVMLPFVKQVVESMRKHQVKRFLYQAGAFSPAPGQKNPLFVRIMRPILGGMMGISGMLRDNDAVIHHLAKEASDIDWTVTRPGMLKDQPTKGKVVAKDDLGSALSFVDLAEFTLGEVRSGQHKGGFPYLSY